ncbi:capsular biosynthesis protein [Roseococcus sp. DSY-14]|uniref:capsular polysaccharide export protein, LipB/KpsS family n=1 Tax=Roseococcus sp. DSY-14 TaxID=3369650 RepID=UPI00387B9CCA
MPRSFLFLQGPISPFFRELGAELARRGHAVRRVNLCLGDRLLWNDARAEDFRGRPEEWPAFIGTRLDGATDLVLLGEQRPLHQAAIAEAQRRGVAVTATDFGYLRPDWVVLERDGMNALSRYPRGRAGILALAQGAPPLDMAPRFRGDFRRQAAWDIAFHLLNELPWPFRHWARYQLHHPIPGYLGTGWRLLRAGPRTRAAEALMAAIPAAAPLFLFAMQMETDYSIRAYSPYEDMDTPLGEAIRSFAAHAAPEARLVVKVHPLDPGLKRWGRRIAALAAAAGVEGRVHLVDGLPLGPALARARGLLTVNSTTGLDALRQGCPAIALGRALWDVPGLAHQGGLDAFWTAPEGADPVLLDAFLRGLAHHLHVRGDFYAPAGRAAAVQAAAGRLEQGAGPPAILPAPRPRLAAAPIPAAGGGGRARAARAPG